ncbi:D-alanyl-D-alanine carboxypeptidase family protein [Patescibacteria group bacterium]|nr:D-alanyl-D-alanine carboxypeptidase family protein [Patescibacteria group bacterium]
MKQKVVYLLLIVSWLVAWPTFVLAQSDPTSKAVQACQAEGYELGFSSPVTSACQKNEAGVDVCGYGSANAVDCNGCSISAISGKACCQKDIGQGSKVYKCVSFNTFNETVPDATAVSTNIDCVSPGEFKSPSLWEGLLGLVGAACSNLNCCSPSTCQEIYGDNGVVLQLGCVMPADSYNTTQNQSQESKTTEFVPQVTIPGTIFTAGKPVVVTGNTLGQYIADFYKFFTGLIAVIAVVMIMWGGFKRIAAAGSAETIKNANSTIISAIVGLVIALMSYSLLQLINPALVEFKDLKLETITREDTIIAKTGSDSDAAASNQNKCANEDNLTAIETKKFGAVYASDPRLNKEAYQKLLEVQNILKTQYNKTLQINSAHRSLATQTKLFNEGIAKHGADKVRSFVAYPSCAAPHLTGGAVDVCLQGQSCPYISSAFARPSINLVPNDVWTDISLLQQVMSEVGWVRYCGEWWHFEWGTARWQAGKDKPAGSDKCT